MTKDEMKKVVCQAIDEAAEKIHETVLRIESEPELGYKETKTAAKVESYMKELGLTPQTGLALTGVKTCVDGGKKGSAVAVLAELDAVGTPDSPKADPLTGAAPYVRTFPPDGVHAGGMYGDRQVGRDEGSGGERRVFAVPAEEYVEIDYRKRLVKEGKIHFLGGKSELVYEGHFDDIDMAMMMHSQGNAPEKAVYIGKSSNGFVGKTVQYIGKTAHAANAPHEGINALNAACLGIMGINALRETFKEDDMVRVHPIITKGATWLIMSPPMCAWNSTSVRKPWRPSTASTAVLTRRSKRAARLSEQRPLLKRCPGCFPWHAVPD